MAFTAEPNLSSIQGLVEAQTMACRNASVISRKIKVVREGTETALHGNQSAVDASSDFFQASTQAAILAQLLSMSSLFSLVNSITASSS